jgi:SAM-dependent methyltransferase
VFARVLKTANLTLAAYTLRHGRRAGWEKCLEVHAKMAAALHGDPADEFTQLIRLHTSLGKRMSGAGETSKARARRLREGWFEKYAPEHLPGIDIGCQYDPLNQTFRRWDIIFGDGDASLMEGAPDQAFYTVYASHVLEHLVDPVVAVRNWYRLLRPGGHLIILVPHRDLYEKKTTLPSKWNPDHKWFWLPDRDEAPHTRGLGGVIGQAGLEGAEVVSLRVLDEGCDHQLPSTQHPVGEFSIEAIVRRPSSSAC